jgi:hypothetical protein
MRGGVETIPMRSGRQGAIGRHRGHVSVECPEVEQLGDVGRRRPSGRCVLLYQLTVDPRHRPKGRLRVSYAAGSASIWSAASASAPAEGMGGRSRQRQGSYMGVISRADPALPGLDFHRGEVPLRQGWTGRGTDGRGSGPSCWSWSELAASRRPARPRRTGRLEERDGHALERPPSNQRLRDRRA